MLTAVTRPRIQNVLLFRQVSDTPGGFGRFCCWALSRVWVLCFTSVGLGVLLITQVRRLQGKGHRQDLGYLAIWGIWYLDH